MQVSDMLFFLPLSSDFSTSLCQCYQTLVQSLLPGAFSCQCHLFDCIFQLTEIFVLFGINDVHWATLHIGCIRIRSECDMYAANAQHYAYVQLHVCMQIRTCITCYVFLLLWERLRDLKWGEVAWLKVDLISNRGLYLTCWYNFV